MTTILCQPERQLTAHKMSPAGSCLCPVSKRTQLETSGASALIELVKRVSLDERSANLLSEFSSFTVLYFPCCAVLEDHFRLALRELGLNANWQ